MSYNRSIRLDASTAEIFKMYELDVDRCVGVQGKPNHLVIKSRGRVVSLTDFLERNAQLAIKDIFPSQDRTQVDAIMSKVRASGNYDEGTLERLKIEFDREWFVIRGEGKSYVGFGDKGVVYNGFPKNIPMQEILNDPNRAYREALEDLSRRDPTQSLPNPHTYLFINLAFDSEFLQTNPITPR